MGKISPVSAKYIVHATIHIDGIVDKPDVIGAIFGQTEGLLGADLELRELQRSGRIGRIEVRVDTKSGKTQGEIIIPSSLDKAETAIVGAALEIIQRIGPCTAKIKVDKIEDVRVSKRGFVIERAKELLKHLMDTSIPDSQELADEVAYSVRIMEIQEYGKERLSAGPNIEDSDEIIVVEGRADVLNLLKHGFKNAIAINGTSIPPSVVELCQKKIVTVFVDGDRGGNLIIKEITSVADIDFVAKAPDGKEVEEITKKEIHKALRGRVSGEQAKLELSGTPMRRDEPKKQNENRDREKYDKQRNDHRLQKQQQYQDKERKPPVLGAKASPEEKKTFSTMLEDLIGTRGAYVLDNKLNILGKVPMAELASTVNSLGDGVYAIVFDGDVEKGIIDVAEKVGVKFLIAMDSKVKQQQRSKCTVLTADEL
ncbi:DNA primase [Candidatus Woesearchaeota archaeon]|nr:DNA primase [Candidatus Woesearchaeota archaeon]